MGLFDFFSKEGRKDRLLNKAKKKILNMYVQSQDRLFYMGQLSALGTPEAIDALLLRFTQNAPNSTSDLEEKEACYAMVVNLGVDAIGPCKKYVKTRQEAINWPLKILAAILSDEDVRSLLIELLSELTTDYERNPEKKEQLILQAFEYREKDIAQAILPFIDDDNETIRFMAVDGLLNCGFNFTREALVERLAEEDSGRIIRELAVGFADLKWSVKGHKAEVEKNLPKGFALTRNQTVTRRGG